MDEKIPHSFACRVLWTKGDVIKVEPVYGSPSDPAAMFYVERHGLFVITSTDRPQSHPKAGITSFEMTGWPHRARKERCGRTVATSP